MPFVGGESIGRASSKLGSNRPRRRIRKVESSQPRQVALTDEQWIADEPCIYRSESPTGQTVCQTCGERGNPLALYSCRLHGQVSIKRKNRSHRACVSCDDRTGPS